MDERSAASRHTDDVDNIPVVRLDDLPPLPVTPGKQALGFTTQSQLAFLGAQCGVVFPRSPFSAEHSRLPSLRSTPRTSSPPSFVVDRVGEMPTGAVAPRPKPTPPPQLVNPIPRGGNGAPPVSTSFVPYEIEDEVPRPAATATPPPIKVKRVKKKGTTSSNGSKIRSASVREGSGSGNGHGDNPSQ